MNEKRSKSNRVTAHKRNAMSAIYAPRPWRVARDRSLELGPRGQIMGIVNVTPDSFSDGGRFDSSSHAVDVALAMVDDGAAIVDIGGESTRPGAGATDAALEQSRVIPVIEELAARSDVLISIDTYRAETARIALQSGAHIVNDVWGLQRDPDLAGLVAEEGAGICIMHTGRERSKAPDVVRDQYDFLKRSLDVAEQAGIDDHAIILDPGFGFAKDPDENLGLMARFSELHELGYPLVAGTSRKRFLGAVTGRETSERDVATAATTALLRMKGAAIFRVHDVAVNRDALLVADAVLESEGMG